MKKEKFNFSFKRVEQAIDLLSEEQLRFLERKIANNLRSKIMQEFKVMDKVSFEYQGRQLQGTIIRLNQKTVTLVAEDDRKWNVSPNYLSKS